MSINNAVLKSFNTVQFTATVQLSGSRKVYLENIAVARNIPPAEMIAGRKTAVLFFDESNPKEAVIIAVYG